MRNFFRNVSRWPLSLVAILTMIVLVMACNDDSDDPKLPDPSAEFTYSISESNTLEVSFTASDSSGSATSFVWDFGDDSGAATSKNATYEYQNSGAYEVTLTVTNESGDEFSEQQVVTVTKATPDPVASFTFEANDLLVKFTNASTDAVSYSWEFGDEAGTSTEVNPSYTYAEAGSYVVALTAKGVNGVEKTHQEVVSVTAPASGLFTDGEGNYFDVFSGEDGASNVGDWAQVRFNGVTPTLTKGVANPDADDTTHPLVGKYERLGESTGSQSGTVRLSVDPSIIPLDWSSRTKFSIRVYFPDDIDYENTLLTRQVTMKLRTADGWSSEIALTKDLDETVDGKWTTLEFDLAEAVGGTDGERTFNGENVYTMIMLQIGGEAELEGVGYWYVSDFVRLDE